MPLPNPEDTESNRQAATPEGRSKTEDGQTKQAQPLDATPEPRDPRQSKKHYCQSEEKSPKTKLVLQIVLTVATVGAFVAAVIYAGLTYRLVKTSQSQLAFSQRAWVGVSEKQISTSTPVFENDRLKAALSFEVENFSDSAAFGEFDGGAVVAPADQQSTPHFGTTEGPCSEEKERGTAIGTMVSTGDAIFPHAKLARIYNSDVPLPPPPVTFVHLWASVCIVYRDQTGVTKHTRLIYRSGSSPNSVPIQAGPYSYMPVTGWDLWETEVQ